MDVAFDHPGPPASGGGPKLPPRRLDGAGAPALKRLGGCSPLFVRGSGGKLVRPAGPVSLVMLGGLGHLSLMIFG